MKVGILGSGEVGQALGDGFVSRGHDVKLGAREATNEKVTKWAASPKLAQPRVQAAPEMTEAS